MNKIIKTFLATALLVSYIQQSLTATTYAYFDVQNISVTTQEKLEQPEIIDEVSNEYKKNDLLRLPETNEMKEDELQEKYGDPVAVYEYSKIYQTGAGQYKTVYSEIPNTYKDSLGNEREIDNTLVEKSKLFESSYFENKANSINVKLPSSIKKGQGITVSHNGVSIKLIPLAGDYSNVAVKDNAILYNDVFKGIDVQYTSLETSIKEDIILRTKGNQNVFQYVLDGNNVYFKEENGVVNVYRWDSSEPVLVISAPMMADASGVISEDVTISLSTSLNSNIITVTANKDWLDDESRSYPVKIDPSVSIPSSNITVTTTSTLRGTYQAKSYSYAGYITDDMIGVPDAGDIGTTRLFYEISDSFTGIPTDAQIDSASLVVYQYTNYSRGTTTFRSYKLEDPWSSSTLTWSNSVGLRRSPTSEASSSAAYLGSHSFDISDTVNDWIKGITPNYGLMIVADQESGYTSGSYGEAFFTPFSSASNAGQGNFTNDKAPRIEINWSYPGDVGQRNLNDLTINLRPIAESTSKGVLNFNGVFFDGISDPGSIVYYYLNDSGRNYSSSTSALYWYSYPNSSTFESYFPNSNKYRLTRSNWQTTTPFVSYQFNVLYYLNAYATKNGLTSSTKSSETFVIYKVQQFDTLTSIANYYGVSLDQIMYDNRVQDRLLVEGNTIFIRNPQKNANKPYNPEPLTDAQKREIDGALMGRGLHCEFGFEPINLNTGNFYMNHTDVAIVDYNGDFSIERTYNSKNANYNSMFGKGWTFEYEEALSRLANDTIVYKRSDGSSLYFKSDGNGGYVSPTGYYYTLAEIAVKTETKDYGSGVAETRTIYEYEIKDSENTIRRFSSQGLLIKITDSQGFETKIDYNSNKISNITSPSGKVYNFATNAEGKITAINLPNGKTLEYGYDSNENLVSYKDANSNTTKYNYDSKHQMINWIDANNTMIIENIYDSEGRVVKQYDALKKETLLEYQTNQTKTTDSNGNITVYHYDDRYRTKQIDYPDGTSIKKHYDANNNMDYTIDQDNHQTSYQYDGNGNIVKQTRFDGKYQSYTFNASNQPLQVVDYDGKTTSYQYDSRGNLTKITNNDQTTIVYEYDSLNRLVKTTDATGNSSTLEYSGPNLSATVDKLGARYEYFYNSHGQVVTMKDPEGNYSYYSYDYEGHKLSDTDNEGNITTYVYNPGGLCIAMIDAKDNRTDFEYDKNDNLVKLIDPAGQVYSYTYDNLGNKLSETTPDNKTIRYEYNAMNLLVKKTDASNNIFITEYDNLGNIVTMTDSKNQETVLSYDYSINKVDKITDALNNTISITYNSVGLITSKVYPDGSSVSYSYDAMNRLASYIDQLGLQETYTYDKNGNITLIEDNLDRETSFEYNNNNQLIKKIDSNDNITKFKYDLLGRIIEEIDPEGNKTVYTYDKNSNVKAIINAKNQQISFSYDKNGNLVSQVDGNGNTTTFTYDSKDRLVKSTDALLNDTYYSYGVGSNIVSIKNSIGAEIAYEYDYNERPISMTDAMGNNYQMTYDSNGNLTKIIAPNGDKTIFEYDAKDRLVKTEYANGLKLYYEYDAMGYLIRKYDNANTNEIYTYNKAGLLTSMTNSLNQITSYEYDLARNVVQINSSDKTITKYSYDSLGNLISITDPEGKITTYQYDKNNNLLQEEDEQHRTWQYTYDTIGQLVKAIDPLNVVTEYSYDNNNNLVSILDGKESLSQYKYDALNQVIEYIDNNDFSTKLYYDSVGRVISQEASDGGISEYLYDNNDQLIKQKDANNNITNYYYDNLGNLSALQTPNGGVYQYEYDSASNITATIDPLNNYTNYTYDLLGRLISKELSNGALYSYNYDALGRVTKVEIPEGLSLEYSYDSFGNMVQQTDQSNRSIEYFYDIMHRIKKVVNQEGQATVYDYDTSGNLASVVTPLGYTTTYEYDPLDRVIKKTDPLGKISEYEYDVLGNLEKITKQGGRVTSFSYDKNSNLLTTTNPLNQTIQYDYDAMNRVILETNIDNSTQNYQYDYNGNVTSWTNELAESTQFTYDGNGNVVLVTDAQNRQAHYEYDQLDRVTKVFSGSITQATYSYDSVGNLIAKTDGNNRQTTYTYDLLGNLTSTTNPLNEVQEFTYNVNGQLEKFIQADGSIIAYDYDKLDRLVSKKSGEEPDILYGYDSDGRLVSMSDVLGDATYEYDQLNRIIKVIQADGNVISYEYDDYGNLAKLIYPDDSEVLYEYDVLDRLIKVIGRNDDPTTYTYDNNNRVVETIRGNNTKTICDYDRAGNLIYLENQDADGNTISSFSYEYDSSGLITTEEAVQEDTIISTFTYNDKKELIKVTQDDKVIEYEYDMSGNRTSLTETKNNQIHSISYTYDNADRLIELNDSDNGITTYEYDLKGNLISSNSEDKALSYKYTVENRLEAVYEQGGLLMAAIYDGNGDRVFTINKETTSYQEEISQPGSLNDHPETINPQSTSDIQETLNSPVDTSDYDLYDKQIFNDERETIFWYGFGQGVIGGLQLFFQSITAKLAEWFNNAWTTITNFFTVEIHRHASDTTDRNNDSQNINGLKPSVVSHDNQSIIDTILIPYGIAEKEREDYELISYVNNINTTYTQVIMEYGSSGEVSSIYEYGLQRTSYEYLGNSEYYLYDGRGSVSNLTSMTGDNVVSYKYDAYGNITTPLVSNNRYSYNGESIDKATGYQYLRARYYDSSIGRFITADSYAGQLVNPLSQNKYTYTENNPVNGIDPSGHMMMGLDSIAGGGGSIDPSFSKRLTEIDGKLASLQSFNAPLDESIPVLSINAYSKTFNTTKDKKQQQELQLLTQKRQLCEDSNVKYSVNLNNQGAIQIEIDFSSLTSSYARLKEVKAETDKVTASLGTDYKGTLQQSFIDPYNGLTYLYKERYVGEVPGYTYLEKIRLFTDQGITYYQSGYVVNERVSAYDNVNWWTDALYLDEIQSNAPAIAATFTVLAVGANFYIQMKELSAIQNTKNLIPEGYYQDANGRWHRPNGQFASNVEVGLPEPQTSTSIGGTHGNSLDHEGTNYGYRLIDKDTGEVLKYGETLNPNTRYSQTYLDANNAKMEIITSGSKLDIHYWQHIQIENYYLEYGKLPGLNKSFW